MTLPAGAVLFEAGQHCPGLPLIDAGRVRVHKAFPNGRELLLYHLHPGEACVASIGALLSATPYGLRATAETAVTARLMPLADFRAALDDPGFRDFVLGTFARRMGELLELVDVVTTRRLDERLAARLADGGQVCARTHQQLADELGSVREMVTRLLRQFAERGWVAVERGRIRVLDAAALRSFSEGSS